MSFQKEVKSAMTLLELIVYTMTMYSYKDTETADILKY